MPPNTVPLALCVLLTLSVLPHIAAAGARQSPSTITSSEQGTFLLHKFARQIGRETYTLSPAANGHLTLTDDFLFTDRGTKVPLKTTSRAPPTSAPCTSPPRATPPAPPSCTTPSPSPAAAPP